MVQKKPKPEGPARQPRRGRERLLEAAVALTMQQGFEATTVEQILATAGLTKGAFFYHFASKDELARAMLDHWIALDVALFDDYMGRAEKLAKDPLQQVLIMVGLIEQHFDELGEPPGGCMITAFLYEAGAIDAATYAYAERSFAYWRDRIAAKLKAAKAVHPPKARFEVTAVADMLVGVIEGAYSLSKGYRDPKVMGAQLRNYKQYLELLFGA